MEMIQDRSGFLVEKHEEHGDIFVSRALVRDLMFVRDPAVVYGINVTHWADFYKPDHIKEMWKQFLGNGLVPNDGESWKRQHKLILPGFHKKRVDAYAPTMVAFTERMLDRWEEGEQRDMRLELNALALEVVASTLFDIDIGKEDSTTIRNAIGDVSEVHVWVSRAWGLQSQEAAQKNRDISNASSRPTETYRYCVKPI